MSSRVILRITRGPLSGQQFVLDERTTCIIGRGEDCRPRLPNDHAHRTISRHHCLLDVNPPDIRIRDFGSLNGTYVNGIKIGQRDKGLNPGAAGSDFPELDLKNNDEIQLGETVFRVAVEQALDCSICGGELVDSTVAPVSAPPVCPTCCRNQPTISQASPLRQGVCAGCGNELRETGPGKGPSVCPMCRANPQELVRSLIATAECDKGLTALRGYQIVRELGRGGMGAVYLARHPSTGEQVALKVMLPHIAADSRAREKFLREIESTRALDHPNVVRFREGGSGKGVFFLTLEYCENGSVSDLQRQRGGTLPLAEAGVLILQALDGLEYAHNLFGPGKGLVHRDLKPANLLLSGSGHSATVKIADYGLAKAFDQAGLSGQTCTGAMAGTPLFMPRQQVINFKYARPEVDVWAITASFYCLLTGKPPRDFHSGKDPWQIILQHHAIPIRQWLPSIPQRVAEVIDSALVDRPEITFKTAAELKKALEAVL